MLAATNEDALRETARLVRDAGRRALVCPTDVTRLDQVARLAGATDREYGCADILLSTAGGWAGRAPFVEMNIAAIGEMADVDVKGTMYVTHAFLPAMIRRRRGTIIGLAATAVVPGRAKVVAYAAVKSAMATFLRGLREEVRPIGIRVATIYPGHFAQDLDYSPDPSSSWY